MLFQTKMLPKTSKIH